MDWLLSLGVFLFIGLLLLVLQLMLKEPGLKEPPRLPALPLIGSMLSLWSSNPPHVLFKALQGKYGQTYSLMMGSHRVIVVNHHAHAREVLLKKGKVFAGRPRTVGNPIQNLPPPSGSSAHLSFLLHLKVTTDLLTRDGKDIAFGDYSATWRFHRKVVHGALRMFGEGSASIEKISECNTHVHT